MPCALTQLLFSVLVFGSKIALSHAAGRRCSERSLLPWAAKLASFARKGMHVGKNPRSIGRLCHEAPPKAGPKLKGLSGMSVLGSRNVTNVTRNCAGTVDLIKGEVDLNTPVIEAC